MTHPLDCDHPRALTLDAPADFTEAGPGDPQEGVVESLLAFCPDCGAVRRNGSYCGQDDDGWVLPRLLRELKSDTGMDEVFDDLFEARGALLNIEGYAVEAKRLLKRVSWGLAARVPR